MHGHVPPNLLMVLAFLLKTKSVSTTAAMLGMSQPSVSRALSRLRTSLHDQLLVRSGNTMARTRRGEELVDRLNDWVASTAGLLDEEAFDPSRLQRRFRIASTDFGVMSVCLPAMRGLRRDAPSLALDFVPLTHAAHRALSAGDIDLAITGLDNDPVQLHRHLLYTDRFVCVTRADHPLLHSSGEGDPVPLDAFLSWPHLGLTVSELEFDRVTARLGDHAARRQVVASLPYFALAPDMLLASDAVMVIPSRAMALAPQGGALAIRPAPKVLGTLDYWLLWHERSHADPAAIWLREQLIAASPPQSAPIPSLHAKIE